MKFFICLIVAIVYSDSSHASIIIIEKNRIFLVKSNLNKSVTAFKADDLNKHMYFKLKFENKIEREYLNGLEAEAKIPNFKLFDKPKDFKKTVLDCGSMGWQTNAQWIGEVTDAKQKWNFYVLIPEGYKLSKNIKKQKDADLKTYDTRKPDPVQDKIDEAAAKANGYTNYKLLDDKKDNIRYYSKDENVLGYYFYGSDTAQSLEINLKVGNGEWQLVDDITVTNHCP